MTPIQYCYKKIAILGSPVYYSIKKIMPEKRDAVVVIAAFYQELISVILDSSDVAIAYQQLHWWRGEIIKIPQKIATHPVCIALQALENIDPQSLFDIVDGIEQTLAFQSFNTFEDVVVHVMRTAGARELLMVALQDPIEKISDETIYQFSLVLELVNYIQHMRAFLRRGLIMFPQNELQQFNVTPELLFAYKTTPAIKNLLHFQVGKIERAYKNACDSLTPQTHASSKYLLVRCDIAMATLRAIQDSGFTVLENYIALTPLKMWWVVYKA